MLELKAFFIVSPRHFHPGRGALEALLMLSALSAAGSSARAQSTGGEDTRLRLNQGIDRRSAEAERKLLEGADDLSPPTTIEIDGRTYRVSNNANEMGQALYVSVTRRQWADVRRFFNAYLALNDRDPMLVYFAQGALARASGNLAAAEGYYRDLLALQPDFLLGRLELARVLFEGRKDRDALRAFQQLRTDLEAQGDKAAGIRRTIDIFLQALEKRRGWQGSFAIGPGYSSNLNQSSASYACLLMGPGDVCLIDRKVPDPIGAVGINFEGSISRRVPLVGQSGVLGKTVFFGDVYPGHGRYSQTNLSTQIGYDHQGARASYTLSPTFDLGSYGPALLYTAWGVRAEGMLNLSPTAALRLELDRKEFDFKPAAYHDDDGSQTEAYLTAWYALRHGWTLFGGSDFVAKSTDQAVNAYRQYGFRAGVNKALGTKASLLLLGSYRHRDYRAYSELFEAKRSDEQFNATAIARFPALSFARLTPEIVVQHTRVKSNIDWLYSYKRTTASVRLSYAL